MKKILFIFSMFIASQAMAADNNQIDLLERGCKPTDRIEPSCPRGATGPKGATGARGATGPHGHRGKQGEKGEKGDRGKQGEKGEHGERGHRGERGRRGPEGPAGPVTVLGGTGVGLSGPVGSTGPAGAMGPTGPAAGGSIIPFASGDPVVLTNLTGGLVGDGSLIGFGSSLGGVDLTGGVITTTVGQFGFNLPRDGTITSLSASFVTTTGLTLAAGTVTIHASVYAAPAGSTTFAPIVGATVALAPTLTGVVSTGTVSTGIVTGLSIPVASQETVVVVFSITGTGDALANIVTGLASAGLLIE